jgi:hypothetical protein
MDTLTNLKDAYMAAMCGIGTPPSSLSYFRRLSIGAVLGTMKQDVRLAGGTVIAAGTEVLVTDVSYRDEQSQAPTASIWWPGRAYGAGVPSYTVEYDRFEQMQAETARMIG